MSPRDAAKAFCVQCLEAKDFRLNACNGKLLGAPGPLCRLYGITHQNAPRPLKAIAEECRACQGHLASDGTTGRVAAMKAVRECKSYECALSQFRTGHDSESKRGNPHPNFLTRTPATMA